MMLKKLSVILGLAIVLSSAPSPVTGFAQEKEANEVHHTGVKRTYLKAKHKVKHAWNKTKTRATTDDTKRDAQEKKKRDTREKK